MKKIRNALISVFHKDGLLEVLEVLKKNEIEVYSTGGTFDFISKEGYKANKVEDLTGYPSILGGRVKTLHPKVFGGILARQQNQADVSEMSQYEIPYFDLVIVDLYPFAQTVASTNDEDAIIEKIDIGGISLIRAAAKNHKDVLVVASKDYYSDLINIIDSNRGGCDYDTRRKFAAAAFAVSSKYDSDIYNYFDSEQNNLRLSLDFKKQLRYGENPHQSGTFYGDMDKVFDKLNGKEISYNNLLDIDAAIRLIADFNEQTFAVLKHNNACGLATDSNQLQAWKKALAGDPVSAFGGIVVTNKKIELETANEINNLFYEVLIAPDYDAEALEILKKKKNRIILKLKNDKFGDKIYRTSLNGILVQDADKITEKESDLNVVTNQSPSEQEIKDLLFANKIVKHTKSNAMVIVKDNQLIASGVGETSRVDAFKQAIEKARNFDKELKGAVLASDAFFPFADNVELAHSVGINAVIQPGGSKRDSDSIEYCNKNGMAMCFTAKRHFKH
jgi:phosphoribosylaminoimidazolecarboxamide formyltransferase/IMP cyclohydrolase